MARVNNGRLEGRQCLGFWLMTHRRKAVPTMQGSAWAYRGLLRIAGATDDLITATGSAEPFQYLSQMQM